MDRIKDKASLEKYLLKHPHMLRAAFSFMGSVKEKCANPLLRADRSQPREKYCDLLDGICQLLQGDETAIALTVIGDTVHVASNYKQQVHRVVETVTLTYLGEEQGSRKIRAHLTVELEDGVDTRNLEKVKLHESEKEMTLILDDGAYQLPDGKIEFEYESDSLELCNTAVMGDPNRYRKPAQTRRTNSVKTTYNFPRFGPDNELFTDVGKKHQLPKSTRHIQPLQVRYICTVNALGRVVNSVELEQIKILKNLLDDIPELLQYGFNFRLAEWKFSTGEKMRALLPFYASVEHLELMDYYRTLMQKAREAIYETTTKAADMSWTAELKETFDALTEKCDVPKAIPADKCELFKDQLRSELGFIIRLFSLAVELRTDETSASILKILTSKSPEIINTAVLLHAEMLVLGHLLRNPTLTKTKQSPQNTLPYCAVSKPCCALCTYCMEVYGLLRYPGCDNPQVFGSSWTVPDAFCEGNAMLIFLGNASNHISKESEDYTFQDFVKLVEKMTFFADSRESSVGDICAKLSQLLRNKK